MAGSTSTRSPISKRRSNRMSLNAAVGVTGEDRSKFTFTLQAKALNLNKHGAALQIHRELAVGSTVVIRHPRGTQVSAKVVSQIAAVEGLCTYGVEFVEHDEKAKNFWGISFPSV
ncbi:MAG TPA: PilZ domain-containing protein [Candidatus Sulfotelmatobacter sp.]|nr:PilZ domain-containing protein [Candidatus Sulfotelmatobacter sp.]